MASPLLEEVGRTVAYQERAHSMSAVFYLMSLPNPVIPWDVAERIVSMTSDAPVLPSAAQIQALFGSLPPAHLATLREILLALAAVVKNKDVNSMNARNLSVCITPCLSYKVPRSKQVPPEKMREELESMNTIINAMVPFLENAPLFYTYLSRL